MFSMLPTQHCFYVAYLALFLCCLPRIVSVLPTQHCFYIAYLAMFLFCLPSIVSVLPTQHCFCVAYLALTLHKLIKNVSLTDLYHKVRHTTLSFTYKRTKRQKQLLYYDRSLCFDRSRGKFLSYIFASWPSNKLTVHC